MLNRSNAQVVGEEVNDDTSYNEHIAGHNTHHDIIQAGTMNGDPEY